MNATFTLTSAAAQAAAPFTIGHAFKQGDVPAGSGVVASIANFQAIAKNAWPDGSLKFAVLSGRAPLAAGTPLTVTLSAGTPANATALTTADLKATGVIASIGAGAFGTVSWATTDWDAPFQTWISGSQMSSWLYRKPIGSDPHLVGWLEVRLYAGGAVDVLPWIENGYLMVAGPTNKSATYTFSLGGTQRLSAAIDLPNHCRTPLLSGAALSYWLGADPGVTPAHDRAYFQDTHLVPKYSAAVPSGSVLFNDLPATFAPLQQGGLRSAMGDAGYHPSIGILPQWDVLYLTSSNTSVWAALQRNAYSTGRYGIHFRDENTNRPVRFSQRPTLGLAPDNSYGVVGIGSNSSNVTTVTATGTSPAVYTNTHHPSMGFMAYLVTGRMYHLESLQFVATINYLKNGDINRNYADGILQSAAGANTVRGAGWSIRTLAQAAAVTPDADALGTELVTSLAANIAWNHTRYVAQANNPQGWVAPYNDYTPSTFFNIAVVSGASTIVLPNENVGSSSPDGFYNGYELAIGGQVRTITAWIGSTRTATLSAPFTFNSSNAAAELRPDNIWFESPWQQHFFTGAYGYAKSLGVLLTTAVKAKLDEFFAWKAQSIIGMFGGTGATEFLYRDAAVYEVAVAPSNTANWVDGSGPWYATWGDVYAATATLVPSMDKLLGDGSLRGGNFPGAGSYWGNLQPALAYAVEHGVAGAAVARARMTDAPNYSALAADLITAPEWSVAPNSTVAGTSTVTTPGPSIRVDTLPLHTAGFIVTKQVGIGTPGSQIAGAISGADDTTPIRDAIIAAGGSFNPLSEYRVVPSAGAHGTLFIDDADLSEIYTGDGAYDTVPTTTYEDGASISSAPQYFGTAPSGSTPTVTGVAAAPAAANLAGGASVQIVTTVAGLNNPSQSGTWAKVSGVGTVSASGLITAPAATSIQQTGLFRFIPTQDANYHVDVVLTVAALAPAGDTTRPQMVGPLAATATATSITATVPAATDNVAVKEYKWRINGGAEVSTGLTRTKSYPGLTPETPYNVEVLAYDTSDNPALAPLTLDVVTLAAPTGPVLTQKALSITLKSKDQALRPNVTGINWAWSDSRGVITSSGGGLSTNALGVLVVPIQTALLSDGIGFLSLDNYTGGNPLDYFGFFGPVRVP